MASDACQSGLAWRWRWRWRVLLRGRVLQFLFFSAGFFLLHLASSPCVSMQLDLGECRPGNGVNVEYTRLPVWSVNRTAGKIASIPGRHLGKWSGVYFSSPYNDIFPAFNGSVPRNAVYRVRGNDPTAKELYEGGGTTVSPEVELIAKGISFANVIRASPQQFKRLFATGQASITIVTGRFPIGGLPGDDGGVLVVGVDTSNPAETQTIAIVPEKRDSSGNQWIYSNFFFHDVNGDGFTDIVTVRMTPAGPPCFPPNNCCGPPWSGQPPFDCFEGPFFPFWGQVIWFEQPQSLKAARAGNWPLRVLIGGNRQINLGPSTELDLQDIDGDGVPEMVAVDFWGKRVHLLWAVNPSRNQSWSDPKNIKVVTVTEKTLGNIYDCEFADVNGDGRVDILATNHVPSNTPSVKASLVAFEIPPDFKTAQNPIFQSHVIDDDFPTRWKPGSLAPGYIKVLPPPKGRVHATGLEQTQPVILMAGDGSGSWYVYAPVRGWRFTKTTIDSDLCDFIEPAFEDEESAELFSDQVVYCSCYQLGKIYRGVLSTSLGHENQIAQKGGVCVA
ncbi:hypothetical protein CBR_g50039 [Chara braunii]|uniref:VCBS repeat-containing protein n=1 Tax=Chara braunii TaxID=69332 RepID=A0A388M646_CHABU|nr:hypothetical protein CBR_g50039 [Chara braunii]|eukprot:GBG89949.1 hypothetical protein CBR_g50039 [Chara braunii]